MKENKSLVWIILESNSNPPTGKFIHSLYSNKKEYNFYPLSHSGLVLTVDSTMWSAANTMGIYSTEEYMWPMSYYISKMLVNSQINDDYYLMATSDSEEVYTIAQGLQADLESIDCPPKGFIEAGYEVIDRWGLSALTNLSYSSEDVSAIERIGADITKYGLIHNYDDAKRIAEIASKVATEHAPFFPAQVVAKIPKKFM